MRVAIIHDWLITTRGGEKCLEAFCELFPSADVYTLIYAPDRVSSLVKSMNIRASRLNDIPRIERVYRYCLPLFPQLIESFDLRNYDLIVSSLVPYERIDIAIRAFNEMRLPLKIVGEGPLRSRLERSAGSNIEFLGWVDELALAALYGGCQALIFPGEEDFGIVPLEAQACGRPVIAYEKGGVLETVIPVTPNAERGGSPTGIFFSEQTPEDLVRAVEL